MPLGRAMDLTHHKYNRLLVLNYHGRNEKDKRTMWKCKCDCGNTIIAKGQYLRSENVKSCGCLNRDDAIEKLDTINQLGLHHKVHGMTGTKLYAVWKSMKQRCNNIRNIRYKNYGGRGISIYKKWNDNFQNFYDWSTANGYEEGLSIERVDNDKGYSPDNCKWIPLKTQARNRTDTIYVEHNGQRKPITEWAEKTNQNVGKLKARYYRGWTNKDIIGR